MIKIVPNRVACDYCKVQLEYEMSDIETFEHEENMIIRTIDKPITVTFTTQKKSITCPNCKNKIML
jgi:uncharacterized UBP type Zn finger protein